MKIDPPLWLAADFESMNVPVHIHWADSIADSLSLADSANRQLFVGK